VFVTAEEDEEEAPRLLWAPGRLVVVPPAPLEKPAELELVVR